jgi:hypothetical protein
MPGVVAGPVTTPWAGTSGNRVVSLQRVGQYQRSYWIPRSSTPALSEKHNSLVRLLNNFSTGHFYKSFWNKHLRG